VTVVSPRSKTLRDTGEPGFSDQEQIMLFKTLTPALALAFVVPFLAPPAHGGGGNAVDASRNAIDLAIIGDTPYGDAQIADLPNLIAHINADAKVRAVVHVGDIKNGSSRCDDSYYGFILDSFSSLQDPLLYTPGDNEWTDCHRANNGGYNPLERLDFLRDVFFADPGQSLGGRKQRLLTQADVPAHAEFVENQMWMESTVVFSLHHAVGSNNGFAPWSGIPDQPAPRVAEVNRRIAAALDWIDRSFALATSQSANGVVLFHQANMWSAATAQDGFDEIAARIALRAAAFGKPVLLIEGDTHTYLVDHPFTPGDPRFGVYATVAAPNVTRIVVQGETSSEWLRLQVDPQGASLFSWERMIR
jgi:Calcineurin-like phosphoesterase